VQRWEGVNLRETPTRGGLLEKEKRFCRAGREQSAERANIRSRPGNLIHQSKGWEGNSWKKKERLHSLPQDPRDGISKVASDKRSVK